MKKINLILGALILFIMFSFFVYDMIDFFMVAFKYLFNTSLSLHGILVPTSFLTIIYFTIYLVYSSKNKDLLNNKFVLSFLVIFAIVFVVGLFGFIFSDKLIFVILLKTGIVVVSTILIVKISINIIKNNVQKTKRV